MKNFKTLFVALVITLIAGQSFGQGWIEEEDLQVFGNTRALSAKSEFVKFSKAATTATKQELKINNTTSSRLEIVGFEVPAGVTVMPKSRIIEGNSESTITVTLFPEIAGSSVEYQVIKIKTKEMDSDSDKVNEKVFKIRLE